MSYIFFSYTRADEVFTLKLADDLRKRGIDIWIDQFNISPGRNWDIEIEEALNNCNILIVIISEKSIKSKNVRDEISYALEENKKIIPVKISDCNLPLIITRFQYIDCTKNYNTEFENLIAAIKSDSMLVTKDSSQSFNLKEKSKGNPGNSKEFEEKDNLSQKANQNAEISNEIKKVKWLKWLLPGLILLAAMSLVIYFTFILPNQDKLGYPVSFIDTFFKKSNILSTDTNNLLTDAIVIGKIVSVNIGFSGGFGRAVLNVSSEGKTFASHEITKSNVVRLTLNPGKYVFSVSGTVTGRALIDIIGKKITVDPQCPAAINSRVFKEIFYVTVN